MSIRLVSSATAGLCLTLLTGCAVTPGDGVGSSDQDLRARAVPVYLNHTYTMLSLPTLAAIQNSTWIHQHFSDVEERTTVTPTSTWTGTYLNFAHTYLELFPEGTFGYPAGISGLGVSDEVTGGFDRVSSQLVSEFGAANVPIALQSHEIGGVETPWFREASPGDLWPGSIGAWLMEYVPATGSTAPQTRTEERAARYQPTLLAHDVVALTYALTAGDTALTRRFLSAVGWNVVSVDGYVAAFSPRDGATRRAVFLEPATAASHPGLVMAAISMNSYAEHHEALGDGELTTGIAHRRLAELRVQRLDADDPIAANAAAISDE